MRYDRCYPLVVEDDSDFRLLLARAFAKAEVPKAQVRMASSGEKALELLGKVSSDGVLENIAPSLIVLDLNLPRMSGLEVLAWIRMTPSLGEVPVFMLTSSEAAEHVNRAFELKINSYFIKPRSFDELQLIVEGMLAYTNTLAHRRSPGPLTDPRAI